MTDLTPHFLAGVIISLSVVIILEIGLLIVLLLNMHIQNRENTNASQAIAQTAQAEMRKNLENFAGAITAWKSIAERKTDDPG